MILKDIGITVNLTDMPEYKEYAEYYLNRNWLVRFFLQLFSKDKVNGLQHDVRCALLNEILERGQEMIEERS